MSDGSMTIMEKLRDLHKQATSERSHYYTASTVLEAIVEIERLGAWVDDLQSEMYINCVYCGHRYGPDDGVYTPMRKVLERHIESCPKHPLSAAKAEIEQLDYLHNLDHSLADQWQAKNEDLSAKMKAFFRAAEFRNVDELLEGSTASFRKLGLLVAARTKALARRK